MKLQRDSREFIELLNSHRVEYLVVSGYAVAFHGYPRYTADIDFLIRPTEKNASRIVAVIESFGLAEAESLKGTLVQREKIVQPGEGMPMHTRDVRHD